MNTTRAKMQCQTIDGSLVKFMAMYSENPEDNSFSQATPSASAEMFITNENALALFQVGEYYYFDITKCSADAKADEAAGAEADEAAEDEDEEEA